MPNQTPNQEVIKQSINKKASILPGFRYCPICSGFGFVFRQPNAAEIATSFQTANLRDTCLRCRGTGLLCIRCNKPMEHCHCNE